MSENPKVDFYLKHRRDIDEWLSIRSEARSALSLALLTAQTTLSAELGVPAPSHTEGTYEKSDHGVVLPLSEVGPVGIICYWRPSELFDRSKEHCWPMLAIQTPGNTWKPHYSDLRAATKDVADKHGMTIGGYQFAWKGAFELSEGENDLSAYAERVMAKLTAAWRDLNPLVGALLS